MLPAMEWPVFFVFKLFRSFFCTISLPLSLSPSLPPSLPLPPSLFLLFSISLSPPPSLSLPLSFSYSPSLFLPLPLSFFPTLALSRVWVCRSLFSGLWSDSKRDRERRQWLPLSHERTVVPCHASHRCLRLTGAERQISSQTRYACVACLVVLPLRVLKNLKSTLTLNSTCVQDPIEMSQTGIECNAVCSLR